MSTHKNRHWTEDDARQVLVRRRIGSAVACSCVEGELGETYLLVMG